MDEVKQILLRLDRDPDCPLEKDSPFRMLSYEAISKMVPSGLIEFGAHSHSHAILSQIPEGERHEEIDRSLDAIRQLTGRRCEIFAYPNGGVEDYDPGVIRILQSKGICVALTAIWGPNDQTTPLMELKRYPIGDISLERFMDNMRLIIDQDLAARKSI